jgi:phosphatidylglycerol:prolipoprotein diacylglycerol transferase
MAFQPVHLLFDLLAVMLAMGGGWLAYRWRLQHALEKTASGLSNGYFVALSAGSIAGAYLFGTWNLYLTGIHELGRSIVGAWAGAIFMVEIYKLRRGVKRSTGYVYAVPLCILVMVGRVGCFMAGLDDQTYGTATTLPWGVDFGDGVSRHPVQLYESLCMLVCLMGLLWLLKTRPAAFIRYGFYLSIGFYAGQRFVWEFFKPYAAVLGPFNLFHFLCAIMVLYSLLMFQKERHANRTA